MLLQNILYIPHVEEITYISLAMDKSCDTLSPNEEQFTCAMQLVTASSLTMVLMTAIKLKVLEAIAESEPLSAHEIASRLSIPNPDATDMLDRMLRLLASHGVVTCSQRDDDLKPLRVYGLTPVSKFFIPNEDGVSLGPLMELVQGEVFIESWYVQFPLIILHILRRH